MDCHIVIYSRLLKYGGGRETWLDYFLYNALSRKFFKNVYIYAIEDETVNEKHLLDCLKLSFVRDVYKVKISKHLFSPYVNNFKYTVKVASRIKRNIVNSNEKSIILSIGSFKEFFPLNFIKNFLKKNNVSIITWLRSIPYKEQLENHFVFMGKFIRLIEKINLHNSDLIIANGYDTLNNYKKLTDKNIQVIPNAVEFKKFEEIGYPLFEKPLKIAFCGRLKISKGFNKFLNSVETYNKKYDKNLVEFYIYGDGDENDLKLLNNFMERNKNIIYKGKYLTEDTPQVLSNIDVVLLLNKSIGEKGGAAGISHSMLEFMASKRIIIAWDNYIHKQALNDTEAIFIEENNVESLAESFHNIICLSNKRKNDLTNMCSNVFEKSKEFDVENHIEKFKKLVSSLNF